MAVSAGISLLDAGENRRVQDCLITAQGWRTSFHRLTELVFIEKIFCKLQQEAASLFNLFGLP